jgi:serine/threonine-protein kinase RsbW
MPSSDKSLEVTLETSVGSIDLSEEITRRIAGVVGFGDEECHKIAMAVRESVINAYQHGNRRQRGKKVVLTFVFEPERLVIHVLDEGAGFELAQVADPLTEENLLRSSGRGIFLIKSFMDEVEVQRGRQGGAELVMAKRYRNSHPPKDSGDPNQPG